MESFWEWGKGTTSGGEAKQKAVEQTALEIARVNPKLLEHHLAEMVWRRHRDEWAALADLWGRERLEQVAADARATAHNERRSST